MFAFFEVVVISVMNTVYILLCLPFLMYLSSVEGTQFKFSDREPLISQIIFLLLKKILITATEFQKY